MRTARNETLGDHAERNDLDGERAVPLSLQFCTFRSMRRCVAVVAILGVIALGCSDSDVDDGSVATSTSVVSTTTSAVDADAVTPPPTQPSTTTSDVPPTTRATTAAPDLPPVPGAASAGDEYFDGLGNGGYDALHYDLDFTIDPAVDEMDAVMTMTALATQTLSSLNLDLVGLTVTGVEVNAAEVSFRHEEEELVIDTSVSPLISGVVFEVVVRYEGTPEGVLSPAWRDRVGWQDAGEYSYVVSEPTGAHGWYPVNDHPIDKATYSISATIPDGLQAIANGLLIDTADNSDGTTTWRYEARDPIASYLVTVAVGEFVFHEAVSETGTPLRDAYRPATELRAKPAIDLQGEMLAVFSELFGPYPFEVYGALVVDDNFGGALETQTLSVFSGSLFGGPFGEIVVAHELAHQWFGDSLTPATWQDIWLNEGFATYAEWVWQEATDPAFDIDAEAASLARSGRSIWKGPGDPGPAGLFDSTVYIRGGLTLHALRRTVGDDAFFETLRTYTRRFAYGNVSTADFIAVAEEISGHELGALFDAWLYDDTTPELPEQPADA